MIVADYLRRTLIEEPGRTVTDLATMLEISRPALSNMLNGNAALSIALALKIQAVFGINARLLLFRQLEEQISAGEGKAP